jgi:hypothetical protein
MSEMENPMPLSDIPIGIAPIFRASASGPAPGDQAPTKTRADEMHARETGNASPATATAAAHTTPTPTSASARTEPVTPASSWQELIAAAEQRFPAPAPDAEHALHREAEREAAPRSDLPPVHVSGAERWIWRHGCNWFELFRLCRRSRCRKAGRCRGEPVACLQAGVRHAPDNVRQFVSSMMKAQELGLSFEEAFEDAADYHDAYFAWLAGLQAAQRK